MAAAATRARSFAAGFASAIGSGMRGAVAGFAILSTAAHAVVRNVGTAATVLGLAARATRSFSVGLLASTTLLKMISGAGVAKLAGLLRLAATAARHPSPATSAGSLPPFC
ncbi:hypothetical protein F8M49_30120 [Rhodococcus zopfii]|uniref:Uncharacterized protein n=1 Tax=Rhodococcus zopfii TaxID=43772 RepID=A0ABU3WX97_9NOCA|nr:hypothetical protein [Rhodococcus zopfii]